MPSRPPSSPSAPSDAPERADAALLEEQGHPWFQAVLDRTFFARAFCPGGRVLDAPCGVGWSSSRFAERAAYVLGVDLCHEAIEKARSAYPRPNLEFRVMDCLDLDIEDASFDVAVSLETLEHFEAPDGARYISELARVLYPGGTLVGTTPSASSPSEAIRRMEAERNPFHRKIYCHRELRKLLRRSFSKVWVCRVPDEYFLFWACKGPSLKQRARFLFPPSARPLLTSLARAVRRWVR